MSGYCYANGIIKPTSDSTIGVRDLGLLRGYGVFDFSRTQNGQLFHFDRHLARFRRSAAALHLPLRLDDWEILEIVERLLAASELKAPAVRLVLTGGYEDGGVSEPKPNLIIMTEELPVSAPESYTEGVKLITVEFQRELPHVKSLNYLNSFRLIPRLRERNASDLLYHSHLGVTECPRSNFFGFLGDTLVTPSEGILKGITRRLVLELASTEFAVQETSLRHDSLNGVDEAFVTSTTKGILPVSMIDGRKIGNGKPGHRTLALMEQLDAYVATW